MEVSIFGPGRGEAIAVHLGDGDWLTIDSCVDQSSGEHALLSYFERIGVSVSSDVRLVVGTHAHDDHVAGLSDLLEAASDAQFVTSSASTSEEFFAAVEADADIERQIRQSVRNEYRQILRIVKARGLFKDSRPPGLHALEQRELWSRAPRKGMPGARVLALSPSDIAIDRAKQYLGEGTAKISDRKRLSASDPNEFAVALVVEFGGVSALLGADLEVGPTGCGWKAVLSSFHPGKKASLYKVPHHGSRHADHEPVWTDLLDGDVISMLAPFRAGSVILPTESDVKRIVSKSSSAFITAHPKPPTPSKATKRTRASLSGVALNVREPYGRVGQVRARAAPPTDEWKIVLSDPASKLA